MDSSESWWMLRLPTVTARLEGLRRAPPQAGQGRTLMYWDILEREYSESVSS